jgi:hypothetical protein
MNVGNAPILALLALSAVFAGCSGGDDGQALTAQERALRNTGITGAVMDGELVPLADVVVNLHTGDRHVRTDDEGRYGFHGLGAGDHLLSVGAYGYKPLTYSVRVWETAVTEQDFVLTEVPTGEPYHETQDLSGFISCEAAVGSMPEDTTYVECGIEVEDIQNDVQTDDVPFGIGTRRMLAEVSWEPTTPAAKRLTLGMSGGAAGTEPQSFGEVQGAPGTRMLLGGGTINTIYPEGVGQVHVYVRAAPSIDEHGQQAQLTLADVRHPPTSAGLVVNQGFSVYTTTFYFSYGPPAFTAIPAA